MPDLDDDGFDEAFGVGENLEPVVEVPKVEPKEEEVDANKDKPADSEPKDPAEPNKEVDAPVDGNPEDDKKEPVDAPEPVEPAPAQPLTREDVAEVINDIRKEERYSGKELETTVQEVMDAYYPDGLSNVLTDTTGKKLETPQDVVEASGGEMTMDQAASWLMNEQFKLDKQVETIKGQARQIAETTVKFKNDSMAVLKKYEPLFKWQPSLQKKVYDRLISQTKVDKDKGVILSSPDVMDHYDFYLEPYQQAFEFSQGKSATNPVETPAPPAPAKPTAEDRMDISGDGGPAPVNDPTDFAQQVEKELNKGI